MIRIVMLAALPQEHACLRRRTPPWERVGRRERPAYRKRLAGTEYLLLETGMGRRGIEQTLEIMCKNPPDLIVSLGFAGSLDPHLSVGALGLGESFIGLAGTNADEMEGPLIRAPAGSTLARHASAWGLTPVRIATVEKVQDKVALAARLGGRLTLVDMESYFAARAAADLGSAFVSMRSVSDGPTDTIDFDVAALSDSEGRVRISRVVRQAACSPTLLRSLAAAWKRARRAADSLARAAQSLLALPAQEVESIGREQRISIVPLSEGGSR